MKRILQFSSEAKASIRRWRCTWFCIYLLRVRSIIAHVRVKGERN